MILLLMLRELVFLIVSITFKIYFDFVKNVLKFIIAHLGKKIPNFKFVFTNTYELCIML